MSGGIFIRPLEPSDWQTFKTIRLKALKAHPDVYLDSYQAAIIRPDSEWQEILDGKGKSIFGLFDGEKIIGLTAVFTWREDPSGQTGVMAMSFIEPEYRGRGLSKLLYEARIRWALDYQPFRKLVVSRREGNEPSKRAMIAHGFTFVDVARITWPDGLEDNEHKYMLDLEKMRRK